jgi:GNAT superfamily N-acetyltransferase
MYLERTTGSDSRSIALRAAMDLEMDERYAEWSAALSPETAAAVWAAVSTHDEELDVVLAIDEEPVGHAALRPFEDALEVKKVYVSPHARGRGISKLLMEKLDAIALERGVTRLVLQTGPLQPEAVGLYESLGYAAIEPYGGYGVIPGVRCFEKHLA